MYLVSQKKFVSPRGPLRFFVMEHFDRPKEGFFGTPNIRRKDVICLHVNGGSYLGRTEPNSGMKACRFPVICHAGNNWKLLVMSITGTEPTGNDYPENRNALAGAAVLFSATS